MIKLTTHMKARTGVIDNYGNLIAETTKSTLEAAKLRLVYEAINAAPYRTGFLRSTIGADVRGNRLRLYARASYAKFVHNGTSRMAARPFLVWAWDRVKPELRGTFAKEFVTAKRRISSGAARDISPLSPPAELGSAMRKML